jgi:hypothetical protein
MPGRPDLKTCCMKKPRPVWLSILVLLSLTGRIFPVKPGSHVWFYTFGTGPGKDTFQQLEKFLHS